MSRCFWWRKKLLATPLDFCLPTRSFAQGWGAGFLVGVAVSAFSVAPALAYWQFFERPPGIERKASPRFGSQKECEAALKVTETKLKNAYPDRYPLVGSCEEYR